MAGFGNLVQKALYLGVGAVTYASEKVGETLSQLPELGNLPSKLQQLADEMVTKGELSAEEAKRWVEAAIARAQAGQDPGHPADAASSGPAAPRRITIDDAPESTGSASDEEAIAAMRRQVADLQAELNRLNQP